MTSILLDPLANEDGTAKAYATLIAWHNGQRPVEGKFFDFQRGGVARIELDAPEPNSVWNISLEIVGEDPLARSVSFSGDTASWNSLVDIDPKTLTPIPQAEALAEWKAVLEQLREYQKDPGPKGDKGDPGIRGEKGDKGDQGIQGVKGDKGDQGIQGVEGQSVTGEKGDKGDPGIQGLKGDKGDPGIQGLKGDQGIQGIQGLKGDKGDQGIQGVKGDQGIQGFQGIQGIQGIQGNVGPSGLPSYANLAAIPNGTFIGQLAIALDTGIMYRWMGATAKWYPWQSGWLTYTTTLSSVTLGTGGSVSAKYRWENGMVHVRTWWNLGSSPNYTSQPRFSLPEPARIPLNGPTPAYIGDMYVRDATGTNYYPGMVGLGDGSSTAFCHVINAAATYTTIAAMSATVPVAVAQSQQVFTDFVYESTNYPL